MFAQQLVTAYANVTQRTLQTWDENLTTGRALPAPYHHSRLGISTGNVFQITDWLAELYAALAEYACVDARLDLVPRNSLHFTFLALATSLFDGMDDMPQEIISLLPLYDRHVRPVTFRIRSVRVLPLQNALLLAGIPDAESFDARQQFAEAVLNSAWSPWLRNRYKNHALPPLFWHTTVARYHAEFLPEPVRALCHRYASETMSEILIGQPRLVAATYNWSRILDLLTLKNNHTIGAYTCEATTSNTDLNAAVSARCCMPPA